MRMVDKRTKIITTIGPASHSRKIIKRLFEEGMTTVRLNFSHGSHKEHGSRIDFIREIAKEEKLPISILLDTKGPEIRVGKMFNGKQKILAKSVVNIYCDNSSYVKKTCKSNELTVSYDMSKDLEIGKKVLVDDGKLILEVKDINKTKSIIKTVAVNDHIVKTNKRINLPGTKFSMPFLSKKDIEDIEFGISKKIDFIAASFVNTSQDILEIRNILKAQGAEHIKIFAKIESQYAINNFNDILQEADGIMIARGDLGLEVHYYDVPVMEKMMIRKCRNAGKQVIVATQMLDSMENNPMPTRAEVTDVYYAVELGADATMLSGESASGKYPIEAVQVMTTINKRAEREFYSKLYYPIQLKYISRISYGKRASIAKKVAKKAQKGEYKFAIVLSRTGQLLTEVAKFRPNVPIIGVTNDIKQVTQFGITSSVFMHPDTSLFNKLKNNENILTASKAIIKKFGGKVNDKYFIVENQKVTKCIL